MKLFVVLAAALVVASAAPQHSSFGLARLTSNFEPEIPEGCTFLSQTQETINGVVQGEYSYKDPVGSTVIVTYSLNEDGTDYQETRKIIKAYETDAANLITVGEVVTLITTDLHDVVVEIVRKVVLASTSGYSEALVDEIMIAVQPVVQSAVDNALRVTQYKHLVSQSSSLINGITVELRPFVVEALKREIAIQRPTISIDQVIELVINQLRVSFESRIRQLIAGYSIDVLGNTDALVQKILLELRAEILSAVNAALAANNAQSYNAQEIVQRILVQITSFVRSMVIQQVQVREQSFIQSLVIEIEAKLKPSVINIISATVRAASAESLAKYEDLVEVIATQLRPVVFEQVRLALRTSAYAGRLDANELTNLLMQKLRPDIAEGVQIQIRLLQEEQARQAAARQEAARREAARREAARLEAQRREAARQEAARREAARLEAERREAARLEAARIEAARVAEAARIEAARVAEEARLEAIRIEQARKAEEARLEAIRIEQARIAEQRRLEAIRIEEARQEAIRREAARQEAIRAEAARREAARLAAERAEADRIAAEREITRIVIKQLEPVVLRIIPAAVRNSKEDLDNYKNLATTIMVQLRPVVEREVSAALRLSTKYSNFNVKELTDFMIVELEPFVVKALKAEIEVFRQETATKATQGFLVKIQPIIRETVIRVMRTSGAGISDEEALIQLVFAQFEQNANLLELITREVRLALGPNKSLPGQSELRTLLESLRPQIRSIIIQELRSYRAKAVVSTSDKSAVVSRIIVSFRDIATQATNQYLASGRGAGQSEDAIASAILATLRNQIQTQLGAEVAKLSAVASGYADGNQIIAELMGQIMAQMRVTIIDIVRVYLANQTPAPAPASKIVSIFGTGKGNSVVVDTKDYHFDYAFDKKRK